MFTRKLKPIFVPPIPPICDATNLPSYSTLKVANEYIDSQCGHLPVLLKWECRICGGYHCWHAGGHADTNGQYVAGADKIPDRILELVKNTGLLKLS